MDTKSKTAGRKAVLDVFRRMSYLSSPEASDATGMSRSTTHRAMEFLKERNLLVVTGKGQSTDSGGKKPILLGLNRTYKHVLCFHIQVGGLAAGIADLKGGLLAESSLSFQPDSALELVLSHMRNSYQAMTASLRLKERDFAGVAVGCNGVADPEAGILSSSPSFKSWGNDIPLKALMEKMFKTPPPVYIDNSNRFGTYAEYRMGLATNTQNVIVLDGHYDGVGAGIVLQGELWRGRHSLAGEIGHIIVEPHHGRTCSCGAKGCLEAMTSMAYLEEQARSGYRQNKQSVIFSQTPPSDVTYASIYRAANGGDTYARKLVSGQASWLAMGVSAASLLLDPELVVFQGSFTEGGEYLLQELKKKMATLGLPRLESRIKIVHSNLGRDRCLVGQAHYVADRFFENPKLYE